MKRLVALALSLVMVLSLAACAKDSSKDDNAAADANLTVKIVSYAGTESTVNILQDQLKKAGFNVETNIQPDYASYTTVVDTRDWDIACSGWTTVTGNPDYATRDIYASYGEYNKGGINDQKIDDLIDKAAGETPAEYVATYTELENYLVTEMAYTLPLYATKGLYGYNADVLDGNSVKLPQSRSAYWEDYSYVNTADNATRTLWMYSTMPNLTSLDPIQANDGSINQLSANVNARIINMTEDDQIMADGSLSYNYAIGEGNTAFYFILRDDCFFSKVEGNHVVGTDILVGGEDVVYSLTRAANKDSVALHKTYNLHNHMSKISMVTDMNELNTVMDADTGKPVAETLANGLATPISALVDTDAAVDNAAGKYQVVKIETESAFPQVLYFLAHQSAGIVNKEACEEMNSKFEVASYDPTVDICYGDAANVKKTLTSEGTHHLYQSGPYAIVAYDDYQILFEKNPGYMAGSENEPLINNMGIKFYKDTTSAASGFRSGEIDIMSGVNTNDVQTLKDEGYEVVTYLRHATTYCEFNMDADHIFSDLNARKDVMHAINQDEFIAYNNNLVGYLYSSFSTLIDTGNKMEFNLEKSAEYLKAYTDSLAE